MVKVIVCLCILYKIKTCYTGSIILTITLYLINMEYIVKETNDIEIERYLVDSFFNKLSISQEIDKKTKMNYANEISSEHSKHNKIMSKRAYQSMDTIFQNKNSYYNNNNSNYNNNNFNTYNNNYNNNYRNDRNNYYSNSNNSNNNKDSTIRSNPYYDSKNQKPTFSENRYSNYVNNANNNQSNYRIKNNYTVGFNKNYQGNIEPNWKQ